MIMTIWAIIRITRSTREWMSFYMTREAAQAVCDAMNANLHKRTTPYTVHSITVAS
jgi:hypothetical protein